MKTWNLWNNFLIHTSTCLSLTSNKANYHTDIYKPHQKFLGFSWQVGEGGTCYFVFTVLPFVLSSALFIFTKVMSCLIKHWRINAIRIACFLDDGSGVASSNKMTLFKFCEKVLTKHQFYYKQRKICLETISNVDLVRKKNTLKKRLLLYTNGKTVSYKKLNCIITHWKLTYRTARESGKHVES